MKPYETTIFLWFFHVFPMVPPGFPRWHVTCVVAGIPEAARAGHAAPGAARLRGGVAQGQRGERAKGRTSEATGDLQRKGIRWHCIYYELLCLYN